MATKLLNAMVMPPPGRYTVDIKRLDKVQFGTLVLVANNLGTLKSYIGYKQNIEIIEKLSGVRVELNREICTIEPGDTLLIMKLNYRPGANTKGQPINEDDLEFFNVKLEGKRSSA